jgi:glutaredoxin 3
MSAKRKIELFSAGGFACEETVTLVNQLACSSCEVTGLDMNDPAVANQAKSMGIRSVPAVVIDGKLADCCSGRGPDPRTLRAAGVGQPRPERWCLHEVKKRTTAPFFTTIQKNYFVCRISVGSRQQKSLTYQK